MNEVQQNIINQFKSFVLENNISFLDAQSGVDKDISYYYSIPYSKDMAKFISTVTDVDYHFITQYVFANNFLMLINDLDNPIVQINFIFNENSLSFEFRHNNGFDFFNNINDIPFLSMSMWHTETSFVVSSKRTNLIYHDDYELAYNETLSDIKTLLDPSITTFKQVLDINEQSTMDILNTRLNKSDFKAISFDEFKSKYSITASSLTPLTGCSIITMGYTTFNSFMKDNYSDSFAKKLRNIFSLSAFQEKFLHRNVQWAEAVANDFSISFERVSKYSDYNCVNSISFGVMPNYDCRCTLFFHDDGTILFHTDNSDQIHDLDSLYDYIKEDFILKMEKNLNMNRDEIRLSHLKVYEMLVYK